MDGRRFDELVKGLVGSTSRRFLLKGFLSSGAAAIGLRGQAGLSSAQANKVLICHVTGSDTNPWNLIEVSTNAVDAHLAHGDGYFGSVKHCSACGDICAEWQDCCSGFCTDLGTNDNCSFCGEFCSPCQSCQGGACLDDNSYCGPVDACTPPACLGGVCNQISNCGEGQSCCPDGSCYDLATDATNCGACANDCIAITPPKSVSIGCDGGICAFACADGFVDCGPNAPGCETELGTDLNCAGCGDSCPEGSSCCNRACIPCVGGQVAAETCTCQCPDGYTLCNDVCTENCSEPKMLNEDSCECECPEQELCEPLHILNDVTCECECDPTAVCDSPATEFDIETCECKCPDEEELCGEVCVDTSANYLHCGECDSECPFTQICNEGVCECPEGSVFCDICRNTNCDTAHCGSCDNWCVAGEFCISGQCRQAQPGYTAFPVAANAGWNDTQIDAMAGSQVAVEASGLVHIAASDPGKTPVGDYGSTTNSQALAPGLPGSSLVGQIGTNPAFEIGFGTSFTAATSGRLYLGVNDNVALFGDNSGAWESCIVTDCTEIPCEDSKDWNPETCTCECTDVPCCDSPREPDPDSCECACPDGGSCTGWDLVPGQMQVGRVNFRAVKLFSGQILIVGGQGTTNVCELYDPVAGAWSVTGSTSVAHFNATATRLLDGRVLVASGRMAEVYDSGSGTWTVAGNTVDHRDRHSATLLNDGRVLVTGGYQGCMKSNAELFDPGTGTWSATANDMSTRRADHKSVLMADGRVLVIGGDDDCGSPKVRSQVDIFDPSTNSFSSTGSLNIGRSHFIGERLLDGRILIAGGGNGFGVTFDSVEIYDPSSGSWSLASSMARTRWASLGNASVLLPDGRVMVVDADGLPCATSEIYDPASGSWSAPVNMAVNRCNNVAVLLDDGRPMAISGGDCGGAGPLPNAEVYTF